MIIINLYRNHDLIKNVAFKATILNKKSCFSKEVFN